MKKEVNGLLDIIPTTTRRFYGILDIMFKFVLFQMTKANSMACKESYS